MKRIFKAVRSAPGRCFGAVLSAACALSAPTAALAQFVGIPAGGPSSLAATVKARQQMFGFENVNPATGEVRRNAITTCG